MKFYSNYYGGLGYGYQGFGLGCTSGCGLIPRLGYSFGHGGYGYPSGFGGYGLGCGYGGYGYGWRPLSYGGYRFSNFY